ncbi:hypothetical protein Tco_0941066 [Tanacetum coccineum]|uniref:Uncharacterized protein n=1 Tax=Tanacetum coccineum TaxID=301880 RepID=A0ABQ5DPS5_9ASTR
MNGVRLTLNETGRALGEATSCRDSCLIALQNKQNEFEKYKAFNDRTIDYEILQTKLNKTLGLLALKDIEIKESRYLIKRMVDSQQRIDLNADALYKSKSRRKILQYVSAVPQTFTRTFDAASDSKARSLLSCYITYSATVSFTSVSASFSSI